MCYYISGYDLLSKRVYLLSYEIDKPLLIRQVRSTEINTLRLIKSSNHFVIKIIKFNLDDRTIIKATCLLSLSSCKID